MANWKMVSIAYIKNLFELRAGVVAHSRAGFRAENAHQLSVREGRDFGKLSIGDPVIVVEGIIIRIQGDDPASVEESRRELFGCVVEVYRSDESNVLRHHKRVSVAQGDGKWAFAERITGP